MPTTIKIAIVIIIGSLIFGIFSAGSNLLTDTKSAFDSKTGGIFSNSQSFEFNAKQNKKYYKSVADGKFTDMISKR